MSTGPNHPPEAVEFLRRLVELDPDPEEFDRYVKWKQDKTGDVELPQDNPDERLWEAYCIDQGWVEYERSEGVCGPGSMTLVPTVRGELALRLWKMSGESSRSEAVKTSKNLRKRRPGRRRAEEQGSETKVLAALCKWHGWNTDHSVTRWEPAKNRNLEHYGLSGNALTRFLKTRGGMSKYQVACRARTLGALLAFWQGLLPSHHSELRPND